MAYLEAFRLEVPSSFPLQEWETQFAAGKQVVVKEDDSFSEFVRAMAAVAYRFKTSDEAVAAMVAEWQACDGHLSFQGHYRQQRDLFIFFTSGLSAMESALYACYVCVAKRYPDVAVWDDYGARRWNTDPATLAALLERADPDDTELTPVLRELSASDEWTRWKDLRNTMVHRSLASRLFEASVGGPAPANVMVKYAGTWSYSDLRADEERMKRKLDWVAVQLRSLLVGAAKLLHCPARSREDDFA